MKLVLQLNWCTFSLQTMLSIQVFFTRYIVVFVLLVFILRCYSHNLDSLSSSPSKLSLVWIKESPASSFILKLLSSYYQNGGLLINSWYATISLWEMRWSNDSRLDSGLRDSRPGWVNVPCLYAKLFTFTVHLSTQEYKWVLANCQGSLMKCWGGYLEIKRHPIQGGVVILLVTSGHGNWDKLIVTWFAYY